MFRTAFIFSAILALGAMSCKSKINLNADYTTTPIVFGLLDQSDSIHYIKITKTFLGNGNNYDYAKVADSSYFKQVSAEVIELFNGEETGRKWTLKDTLIKTKAEGVFYSPEQKVYIFHEKDLKEDHQYKLVADLNEGEHQIDATTDLLSGFEYKTFNISKLNFAAANASINGNYKATKIHYEEALNGQRYQTSFIFTIRETYTDGSTKLKDLRWQATLYNGFDDDDIDPTKPTSRVISFAGEGFYDFIANKLEVDEDVSKREFVTATLLTEIAHTELARYMDISGPSSSLAQSTPLFTNINGGLGLFSSRHRSKIENMEMLGASMEELCIGKYTQLLKFCSSLPEHFDKGYYCN